MVNRNAMIAAGVVAVGAVAIWQQRGGFGSGPRFPDGTRIYRIRASLNDRTPWDELGFVERVITILGSDLQNGEWHYTFSIPFGAEGKYIAESRLVEVLEFSQNLPETHDRVVLDPRQGVVF